MYFAKNLLWEEGVVHYRYLYNRFQLPIVEIAVYLVGHLPACVRGFRIACEEHMGQQVVSEGYEFGGGHWLFSLARRRAFRYFYAIYAVQLCLSYAIRPCIARGEALNGRSGTDGSQWH